MQLSTNELNKIQKTLENFPEVSTFVINNIPGPIGNILTISFEYYVNETVCNLTVEITGVQDW
jgi:hypothetical protein